MSRHAALVDQVVPQSAIFLTAAVFEYRIGMQRDQIGELVGELARGDFDLLNRLIEQTIGVAATDDSFSKSWPTLLKSQAFYEKFMAYIKGRESAAAANVLSTTAPAL